MAAVGVHEAKTNLSRLIRRVNAGEEIVITRSGKPVARLIGIDVPADRVLDRDVGAFEVPDNFNDPLPDDLLKYFDG